MKNWTVSASPGSKEFDRDRLRGIIPFFERLQTNAEILKSLTDDPKGQ